MGLAFPANRQRKKEGDPEEQLTGAASAWLASSTNQTSPVLMVSCKSQAKLGFMLRAANKQQNTDS